MDDDLPFLPPEIIRNILKRIPVKSLMRFQCVCRQWRILFKSKSFIADHLDRSNHQNSCLLIQHFDLDDPPILYFLDSEMQVWEFQNPPLLSYLKQGKISGISNGLLCVQINKHDGSPHFLLLWNPAIREVRLVAETNILKKDYRFPFIGFGFSPIINDYKIVIAYFPVDYAAVSAVKVYSLSSGSWKEEKFRLNDTGGGTSPCVTVNGVMFLWGYKTVGEDDEDERLIVSFDLAVEVFTVIPTPQLHEHSGFTVYEEKLAIFSWIQDPTHSAIDLWVMEEGVGASGEIWSWTKKYSIGPYPCLLSPRTIWRNEIVCYSHREGESTAVFLNPTTKKTWKFAISTFDYMDWIFNYAESLVPVGGMKSSTIFL